MGDLRAALGLAEFVVPAGSARPWAPGPRAPEACPAPQASAPHRACRWTLFAIGLCVVALLAAGGWLHGHGRSSPPPRDQARDAAPPRGRPACLRAVPCRDVDGVVALAIVER